ncbi:hypothetical protein RE432_17560 [Pusillimonas sp. SM2304]|uniref:hypothetical protein n=1 Tax=Pusillimonas sp. SM2304 TaxID=3073241 RepID=UPI002874184E|nr:hypothetical protein [Pusillimonas sp. SM2304]MDS1142246.1 hypothetical protein [Pusillimonas sp. SM2304]
MNYNEPDRVHPDWVPVGLSGWLDPGRTPAQADLQACLAQLCRALLPLHEQNLLYGRISPDHVFVDAHGTVQIDARQASPFAARAATASLHDAVQPGFAAFEQYVDDPAWPLGPWTDIYGMCALIRTLILKQPLPDAVQRMVSETSEPLRDMALPGYACEWLSVIDRGTSLLPQLRFDSVQAFAEKLGLPLAPAEPAGPAAGPAAASAAGFVAVPSAAPAAPAPVEAAAASRQAKAPVWMIGVVAAALIALLGWMLRDPADSTSVAAVPPAYEPAPGGDAASGLEPAPEPEPVSEPAAPLEAAPEYRVASVTATLPGSSEGVAEEQDIEPAAAAAPALDLAAHTAARQTLAAADREPAVGEPAQADAAPAARSEPGAEQRPEQKPDESPAAESAAGIRVQLSIKPWGEVFINGASRGVSPPLRSLSLKPGEYRVRVINGDLPPHQQTLTVRAAESAAIAHHFDSDR